MWTLRGKEASLEHSSLLYFGKYYDEYSEPVKMTSSVTLDDREIAKNETPLFDDNNNNGGWWLFV